MPVQIWQNYDVDFVCCTDGWPRTGQQQKWKLKQSVALLDTREGKPDFLLIEGSLETHFFNEN